MEKTTPNINLPRLNLPEYNFRIQFKEDNNEIFDPIRRKFVSLTPEEWVRQNFMQYLINDRFASPSLLSIEKVLPFGDSKKRTDIVVYNNEGIPIAIVECKATNINITQDVFDQIARYNMKLKVDYLIVTNGIQHYCCFMNYQKNSYSFIEEIPLFNNK